jgi:hypothetical protein
MTEFAIKKSDRTFARGRNGYFGPRRATIHTWTDLKPSNLFHDTVSFEIYSSHHASSPPAMLRLPREEMRDFAIKLLAACGSDLLAFAEQTARLTKDQACHTCEQCHAEVPSLVLCPDGAEVCRPCFDAGAH